MFHCHSVKSDSTRKDVMTTSQLFRDQHNSSHRWHHRVVDAIPPVERPSPTEELLGELVFVLHWCEALRRAITREKGPAWREAS